LVFEGLPLKKGVCSQPTLIWEKKRNEAKKYYDPFVFSPYKMRLGTPNSASHRPKPPEAIGQGSLGAEESGGQSPGVQQAQKRGMYLEEHMKARQSRILL
jgi:hypothetical protein